MPSNLLSPEEAKAQIREMSEKTRSEPPYKGKSYLDPALDAKNPPLNKPFVKSSLGGGSGVGDLDMQGMLMKKPTPVKKKGGVINSASSRADGCCIRGKTRA